MIFHIIIFVNKSIQIYNRKDVFIVCIILLEHNSIANKNIGRPTYYHSFIYFVEKEKKKI